MKNGVCNQLRRFFNTNFMTFRSGFSYFTCPIEGLLVWEGETCLLRSRLLSMRARKVESEPENNAENFHPTTSEPESTTESDRKISAVEDRGHIVCR